MISRLINQFIIVCVLLQEIPSINTASDNTTLVPLGPHGELATAGQFPHHVGLVIRITGALTCCGAIIGQRRVITSAKCIEIDGRIQPARTYSILSGTLDHKDPDALLSNVVRITAHPRRDWSTRTYNFAVLESAIDLFDLPPGAKRAPIHVASQPKPPGTKCWLSGWVETENGTLSDELRFTKLKIRNDSHCGARQEMGKDFICAEAAAKGRQPGVGDWGGALVCRGELVGIMSWGARDVQYSKFASVWSIRHWALDDDPTAAEHHLQKDQCEEIVDGEGDNNGDGSNRLVETHQWIKVTIAVSVWLTGAQVWQ